MREIKFRAYYRRLSDNKWIIEGEYTLKDLTDRGICFDQERIEWVQFTGLYDKNRVEIYEGDILSADNGVESIVSVGWEDMYTYSYFHPVKLFEVIGNIHENPELLEADNELD